MSPKHKKLEQIKYQHQISEILREDNGVSCHFDYHVNLMLDDETIKLNVLTYNERHDEYMLMHTVKGSSSIDCLSKMLDYVRSTRAERQENSYTVTWKRTGESEIHRSYFRAVSEDEAQRKFMHEKDQADYSVESIVLNPVA